MIVSAAMEGVTPISPTEDDWREERDLAVIKREIRRAKYVFVYTDFGEAVRLPRQKVLDLLNNTRRPLMANIRTGNKRTGISVFVHAEAA